MYRTDKQFMRNPATAASRIYVGSLAENVINVDLEEKFRVHGNILGLVLQKGFGFIQFENEAQAQAAINAEHGTLMNNKKINVRQAHEGKNKQPFNQNNNSMPMQRQPMIQPQNLPPLMGGPPVQQQQQMQQNQLQQNKPPAEMVIVPHQSPIAIDNENKDQQKSHFQPPRGPRGGWNANNNNKSKRMNMDREPNMDRGPPGPVPDSFSRDGPPPYYPPVEPASYQPEYIPPAAIDRPERNDCEIIVVLKSLIEYAEYIESRLKGIGLIVDLLFPNEDVPIGKVLANISSRGCLYAILVMPQNEEHRSLTLNVLYGIPQEHRNMPLEDSLIFISRNFEGYMRGDKMGAPSMSNGNERHPENMQLVFNLLAENRQLSTVQYDRVIKYLQDRREMQRQQESFEGEEKGQQAGHLQQDHRDASHGGDGGRPDSKQAELQSRIMNILNKSAQDTDDVTITPTPKLMSLANLNVNNQQQQQQQQQQQANKSQPTPLLNDPTVQKALDSLLSGDMFRSMSGGK